jgi:hypothetical protein
LRSAIFIVRTFAGTSSPKHVEAVVQLEFKIGSISWIKLDPNPVTFAISGVILEPDWVPKTYIGLAATANDDPSTSIADFNTFRSAQQFRAMAYCHVGVAVDDKTQAVTKVVPIANFTDPGYTPPFSLKKFPSAGIGSVFDGWQALKSTWSFSYHAGELSAVSSVVTGGRHPNSTIIGRADDRDRAGQYDGQVPGGRHHRQSGRRLDRLPLSCALGLV